MAKASSEEAMRQDQGLQASPATDHSIRLDSTNRIDWIAEVAKHGTCKEARA
jgi:hypothetical protein